jgi:hypothetical protein
LYYLKVAVATGLIMTQRSDEMLLEIALCASEQILHAFNIRDISTNQREGKLLAVTAKGFVCY